MILLDSGSEGPGFESQRGHIIVLDNQQDY